MRGGHFALMSSVTGSQLFLTDFPWKITTICRRDYPGCQVGKALTQEPDRNRNTLGQTTPRCHGGQSDYH